MYRPKTFDPPITALRGPNGCESLGNADRIGRWRHEDLAFSDGRQRLNRPLDATSIGGILKQLAMTPQEALKEAARAGRAGQFEVTRHALQRMGERGATRWDICLALRSATAAIQQDDDGRELIVVIVFTGRGIVVTVF